MHYGGLFMCGHLSKFIQEAHFSGPIIDFPLLFWGGTSQSSSGRHFLLLYEEATIITYTMRSDFLGGPEMGHAAFTFGLLALLL